MNANELMLEDWVYAKVQVDDTGTEPVYETIPKRVSELSRGINGIYTEDTSTFAGAEILPIPLTPEILKENGWNRYGALCSGNGCTISVWSEDLFYFSYSKTHHDTPSELISCHIHYVHELQHALRLAGIKKEIVL